MSDHFGMSMATVGGDARSSFRWFQMADLLERSYKLVAKEARKANRKFAEVAKSEPPHDGNWERSAKIASHKIFLARPASMLAAMSIECSFKGVIAMTTMPPKQGHPPLKLAYASGFIPTAEQCLTLSRLAKMIQLGRYHLDQAGDGSFELDSRMIDELLKSVGMFVDSKWV